MPGIFIDVKVAGDVASDAEIVAKLRGFFTRFSEARSWESLV